MIEEITENSKDEDSFQEFKLDIGIDSNPEKDCNQVPIEKKNLL